MKIKYILTAAAVFCTLSVAAFAAGNESSDTASSSDAASSDTASDTASNSEAASSDTASDAATSSTTESKDEDNSLVESGSGDSSVDTGIGGVAAVVGVITLAGAAVVISRKK